MVWPQSTLVRFVWVVWVAYGDKRREWLFAFVVGCEADVVWRVVVFCRDFEYERQFEEVIDNRYHFPPPSNRQRTVLCSQTYHTSGGCYNLKLRTHWRTEVFLKVDDNKCWLEGHRR
jgi:hypothetical protein